MRFASSINRCPHGVFQGDWGTLYCSICQKGEYHRLQPLPSQPTINSIKSSHYRKPNTRAIEREGEEIEDIEVETDIETIEAGPEPELEPVGNHNNEELWNEVAR